MAHLPHTTAELSSVRELDVREIPPRENHAAIFRVWAELPVGAAFDLVNDRDPMPLVRRFAARYPEAFEWVYLDRGPGIFRVRIARVRPDKSVATKSLAPGPSVRSGMAEDDAPTPDEIDTRGLKPLEPLIRILSAALSLPSGGRLRARTDRRPVYLFPELEVRGIRHRSVERADGSWLTIIQRD